MDRARIFELIDVAGGRGLEVGALNKPIITRDRGPVEYVDRATRDDLRAWYAGDPALNVDDIVPIDHVWADQPLVAAVGGERVYDYLLASHVIEHAPDLIGWLAEIAGVLVDGGQAVFWVPDKRFTFDIDRRVSSGAEVVDAHVRGLRRPDARQIFDHFHLFRDPATGLNRDGRPPTDATVTQDAREILALCRRIQTSGEYFDAHCWVFTPQSLVDLLDLICRLDLLDFEIARLEPTEPGSNEFLLILRRLPEGLSPEARRAAFVASAAALSLPPEPDAAMVAMAEALAETAEALAEVRARLAAIEASSSWRITEPLRAAVTWLRGGRG